MVQLSRGLFHCTRVESRFFLNYTQGCCDIYAPSSLFFVFPQMRRWLVMLLQELLIVDVAPAFRSPTATHWTTIISHQAPGSFAYNTQWPLHCGGVQCSAASCSFSFAFTLQKVSYHGVTRQRVALNGFWSTFQAATYYLAYECVEFISTHSSACAIKKIMKCFEYFGLNHWKFMATHARFNWHIPPYLT